MVQEGDLVLVVFIRIADGILVKVYVIGHFCFLKLVQELHNILAFVGMLGHLLFQDEFGEQLLLSREHLIFTVFGPVNWLLS